MDGARRDAVHPDTVLAPLHAQRPVIVKKIAVFDGRKNAELM